jgi:hypothetical protein
MLNETEYWLLRAKRNEIRDTRFNDGDYRTSHAALQEIKAIDEDLSEYERHASREDRMLYNFSEGFKNKIRTNPQAAMVYYVLLGSKDDKDVYRLLEQLIDSNEAL